jgi:hypothetical protein
VTKIILFLLQGIPESLGLISCGLVLARVKLRWGIVLAAALLYTLIIYLIRQLPLTFGLHSAVGILLLAVFMAKATRVTLSISFVCAFASTSILTLLELLIHEFVVKFLHLEVNNMVSDSFLWNIMGIPQALLLIITALLLAKYRKPLEGMWKI